MTNMNKKYSVNLSKEFRLGMREKKVASLQRGSYRLNLVKLENLKVDPFMCYLLRENRKEKLVAEDKKSAIKLFALCAQNELLQLKLELSDLTPN